MLIRRSTLLLALAVAVFCSMGAEFRTQNFVVIASDAEVCKQVGQWAEHYRKEKAILWLGKEMPNWSQPCPLRVSVTMDPPSGETEFNFGMGGVQSQRMKIRGPLDRLIHSVLPHEVTHTVFAHHFRAPVPRWMDEGGSVLSEDDLERDRHDKLARNILNKGQQIPMRELFGLREYPPQVMCLYAQGYSMCDYLVKRSNRQHLLNFVGAGMQYGWDSACKSYFGHDKVEQLEQAWLQHLRETKNQPTLASNTNGNGNLNTNTGTNPGSNFIGASNGKTVRMTVPPAQPVDPQPIARGVMGGNEQTGRTQWQSGVKLETPVPIAPPTPRIPSANETPNVQLNTPTRVPSVVFQRP